MTWRARALSFVALGPLVALLFGALPAAISTMRPARRLGAILFGSLGLFALGGSSRRRGAFAADGFDRAAAPVGTFASCCAMARMAMLASGTAASLRAAWPPDLD